MILEGTYFREKPKAIALLFYQKLVISKRAYFREKSKAIALLFDQKSVTPKGPIFAKNQRL